MEEGRLASAFFSSRLGASEICAFRSILWRLVGVSLADDQALQFAAIAFRRPGTGCMPTTFVIASRLFAAGPFFDACSRLVVKGLCDRGRTALVGERLDDQLDRGIAPEDVEPVADASESAGPATRVVHADVAGFDGVPREAPRFEQSRGPQPLVDAESLFVILGVHRDVESMGLA